MAHYLKRLILSTQGLNQNVNNNICRSMSPNGTNQKLL